MNIDEILEARKRIRDGVLSTSDKIFWDKIRFQLADEVIRLRAELVDERAKSKALAESLEKIRDRKTRVIMPWTHERAADEYASMLDMDREEARAVLAKAEGKELIDDRAG